MSAVGRMPLSGAALYSFAALTCGREERPDALRESIVRRFAVRVRLGGIDQRPQVQEATNAPLKLGA